MSLLTLEISDSERSKFIDLISDLDYIRIIEDENIETLKIIENGIREALEIDKNSSISYTLDDLYSSIKNG